jgi:integrating conjugative element protein (TIGR03756 family)
LPDAVVTVFRQLKSDPWDYANHIIDPPAYQVGAQQIQNLLGSKLGDGYENVSSSVDNDNHFKEVDVIGNPVITVFKKYNPALLASVAKPLMPYYLSLADAYLWRSPQREIMLYPQKILPGVHIVGSLIDDWGPIYPRTGFLDQPADAKAAAVIALRAGNIATRSTQPHLYHELTSGDCGTACQVSAVKENNDHTQWQMVYPLVEKQCIVFGANDLSELHPWGSKTAQAGDGNYAWVLWRFYKGCIPHSGKYLGSTHF